MTAVWGFDVKAKFKRQYKSLDSQTQKRVDKIVGDLRHSENPALLGEYKPDMRVFAFDMGRKYRIIYSVDWSNNTIELLRVCDHKSAYGRD